MYEAEEAFLAANTAAAPGTYLVSIIPQLQYVPEWVPGAGFKSVARRLRSQLIQLLEKPFQATVTAMVGGSTYPN